MVTTLIVIRNAYEFAVGPICRRDRGAWVKGDFVAVDEQGFIGRAAADTRTGVVVELNGRPPSGPDLGLVGIVVEVR